MIDEALRQDVQRVTELRNKIRQKICPFLPWIKLASEPLWSLRAVAKVAKDVIKCEYFTCDESGGISDFQARPGNDSGGVSCPRRLLIKPGGFLITRRPSPSVKALLCRAPAFQSRLMLPARFQLFGRSHSCVTSSDG